MSEYRRRRRRKTMPRIIYFPVKTRLYLIKQFFWEITNLYIMVHQESSKRETTPFVLLVVGITHACRWHTMKRKSKKAKLLYTHHFRYDKLIIDDNVFVYNHSDARIERLPHTISGGNSIYDEEQDIPSATIGRYRIKSSLLFRPR